MLPPLLGPIGSLDSYIIIVTVTGCKSCDIPMIRADVLIIGVILCVIPVICSVLHEEPTR